MVDWLWSAGLARDAAMGPHTQQWTICAAIYFGSWKQDKFHIHQSPEVLTLALLMPLLHFCLPLPWP